MQINDISFADLKRLWMKFSTMGQILSAVDDSAKLDGIMIRNTGFCLMDLASELNDVLAAIGEQDEAGN